VDDLIWPIFVIPGTGIVDPIPAMPGVNRMTVDKAVEAAKEAADLGIPALATFPNIEMELRDETGSNSLVANNLINQATAAFKKAVPNIGIITDVALDPFTSHGHDGILRGNEIVNDETVDQVCRAAIMQADAGAGNDEDRPNQVVHRQPVLLHQPARPVGLAVAPHAAVAGDLVDQMRLVHGKVSSFSSRARVIIMQHAVCEWERSPQSRRG
jgi:hypothetical protein